MGQKELLLNFTGTVCVIGMALSTMSFNSTSTIQPINDEPMGKYYFFNDQEINSTTVGIIDDNNYLAKNDKRLLSFAESIFGSMREANEIEVNSVNSYISNISIDTGASFY